MPRIGILTGGGDCPGLNAVIRSVVLDAARDGTEVVGILDGFLGLIENRTVPLAPDKVRDIIAQGGTILGASNKSNPGRFCTGTQPSGAPAFEDVTDRCMDHVRARGLEALLIVGGDGTMSAAQSLMQRGVNCIGIPKTIDNDLEGTDLSFGFLSAAAVATEAIDRLQTTAASHHRAMVVEVMGRNAGWIALHAGVAAGADVILVPEIPFSLDGVAKAVASLRNQGRTSSIICIAEGAAPRNGERSVARTDPCSPDPVKLGGIARVIADGLQARTGIDSRYVILGHTQRGGSPVAADRTLGTQFGHIAVGLFRAGARNRMAALRGGRFTDVDLAGSIGKQRLIRADEPLLAAARAVGVSFGEG